MVVVAEDGPGGLGGFEEAAAAAVDDVAATGNAGGIVGAV